MKLATFVLGKYQSNCYLLYKNYKAMIIDPGYPEKDLIDYLEKYGLILDIIYITHGHSDHVGGVNFLKKRYPNAVVYAPKKDFYWYSKDSHKEIFEDIIVDRYVKENDIVYFGEKAFRVIETPGHSYGSSCLYYDNVLFSGDTLFYLSVGRTDLYLGSQTDLIKSIKNKLFILPKNTVVYPGHGRKTTIIHEINNNPFVGKE